jgi:hypothetical protein
MARSCSQIHYASLSLQHRDIIVRSYTASTEFEHRSLPSANDQEVFSVIDSEMDTPISVTLAIWYCG